MFTDLDILNGSYGEFSQNSLAYFKSDAVFTRKVRNGEIKPHLLIRLDFEPLTKVKFRRSFMKLRANLRAALEELVSTDIAYEVELYVISKWHESESDYRQKMKGIYRYNT
eukprot:TRINITY_DN12537_c0_g1_i1.p1 TRINITY_DN12537_c0_g1~~TRINITY_DN12537_c0_g1_i1.p1  ORF type:complete len:111 (+),score=16.91 TRINITY_DN12537_c0_g1_i1:440-772(+)